MAPGYQDPESTVFVSNIETRVTEEMLWELFLQAGPLRNVHIPSDRATGKNKTFGFITFRDPCSVAFACELFNTLRLFKRSIYCKPTKDNNKATANDATSSTTTPTASPMNFATPVRPNHMVNGNQYGSPTSSPMTPLFSHDNREQRNSGRDYGNNNGPRENDRGANSDRNRDGRYDSNSRDGGGGGSYNKSDEMTRYDPRKDDNSTNYTHRNDDRNRRHDDDNRQNNQYNRHHQSSPNTGGNPGFNNQLFARATNQSMHTINQQQLHRTNSYDNHSPRDANYGPMRNNDQRQHRMGRRQKSQPY